MDLTRVLVIFLTHLITLDLNSAESGDSDVEASEETTTPYVPPRFALAYTVAPGVTTNSELKRASEPDDGDVDPQSRAVYWIPTSCDSLAERGYTCVGCGESLHCMGGNFALKAICHGFRPFCNNGVCSATRGEKCQKEGQDTHINDPAVHADPDHVVDSAIQADVQNANATLDADEIDAIPADVGSIRN